MSTVEFDQAPRLQDRQKPRSRSRRMTVSGRRLVVKSASGAARRQLRREAELLDQLRDLAVVQLVALRESDDRTDLVTQDAGRHSLSVHSGMAPSTLLRAVTEAAETLTSLHDAGWVHGAVCSDHVVVDDDGRATWCSLASARPTAADPAGVRSDLLQFRSMVDGQAASRDPEWSFTQWRRFRSSVRTIAPRTFVAADHEVPTPQPTSKAGAARSWSRSAIGLVVVAAAIGVSALLWGATDRAASQPDLRRAPRSCPRVDPYGDLDMDLDGCADEVTIDGELLSVASTTYRVGRPGDQIAIGSLPCGTVPAVLLLRPSNGSVYVFDEWPSPDSTVAARRVAIGLSDAQLSIERRSGCRDPWIVHGDGSREALSSVLLRQPTAGSGQSPPSSNPTEEDP